MDDLDYTNTMSLKDDPDFPPSIVYDITRLRDDSANGVSFFTTTGLQKGLNYTLQLTNSRECYHNA